MTIFDHLHNIPALAINNVEAFAIAFAVLFPAGVLVGYLWRKY